MKKLLYLSMFLWLVLTGCTQEKKEFTVLQWNIWQEGTMVPGGYEAIVDEIIRLRPDFVTLSEVRNYNNTNFTARLTRSLKEKGETYYSFYTYDTGLLSRYPITDSLTVFPENGDHGSIYRLTTDMNGKKMAVYTSHLDYLDDAYYNVRGYDGSTWEEIPIPTTVEEVLERNVASQRDDAIKMFIEQAKKDMGNMLDYIDMLNGLDTEGVEPMSHVFPVHNVFREDVVTNGDGHDATLANAPAQKDDAFKVPKTVE